MHRFYCPNLPSSGAATLNLDEAHHARKVLRLDVGAEVELFNGRGRVACGVITNWSSGATVKLRDVCEMPPLRPVIDVAVAIPKGPRADEMVNQLSQLGADRLVPLLAERAVVEPGAGKLERFAHAAIESAKQCGRAHLMTVSAPATLAVVLGEKHDLRVMAAPGGSPDISGVLRQAGRALILIGPEGGWTDAELDAAQRAGCVKWSLSQNILRIETAAVAAVAIVRSLTAGRAS